MQINGFVFNLTCCACPEQYDVFNATGQRVAYVRLRHGYLAAYYPDVEGECIYAAEPEGDGCFDSNEERYLHLTNIAEAIQRHQLTVEFPGE